MNFGILSSSFGEFPQLGLQKFPGDAPSALLPYAVLEDTMLLWKKENKFGYAHFNFSPYLKRFCVVHPEFVPIVQVRDLRDVLVSYVYYHWERLEEVLGPSMFEEKLRFMILLDHPIEGINNLYRHAADAVEWVKRLDSVVVNFEDLIGINGGGSLKAQRKRNWISGRGRHRGRGRGRSDTHRGRGFYWAM